MKRILICLSLICQAVLLWPCVTGAENWISLPKRTPAVYYDRDSIQHPYMKVYEWGLFTVGRPDRDIIRIWTKFDGKDQEAHNILYEIKFSTRICKAVYAIDQNGNLISPHDTSYRPILPGSLENDLYDWTIGWIRPGSRENDFYNWAVGWVQP